MGHHSKNKKGGRFFSGIFGEEQESGRHHGGHDSGHGRRRYEETQDDYNQVSASQTSQIENGKPCPQCNISNATQAKFCQNCGTSLLPQKCTSCGSNLSVEAKFCSNCGNKN